MRLISGEEMHIHIQTRLIERSGVTRGLPNECYKRKERQSERRIERREGDRHGKTCLHGDRDGKREAERKTDGYTERQREIHLCVLRVELNIFKILSERLGLVR